MAVLSVMDLIRGPSSNTESVESWNQTRHAERISTFRLFECFGACCYLPYCSNPATVRINLSIDRELYVFYTVEYKSYKDSTYTLHKFYSVHLQSLYPSPNMRMMFHCWNTGSLYRLELSSNHKPHVYEFLNKFMKAVFYTKLILHEF